MQNKGRAAAPNTAIPPAYGKSPGELSGKLIETAPDAMLLVEPDGKIVLVNAQLEKLFGYSRDELIGKEVHLLVPARYRARHRETLAQYFADPRTRPMGSGLRIFGRKKNGREFRADISLSPFTLDNTLLVTAAIRDITARIRAEEQIEFDYQVQKVISTILRIALEPGSLDEQLSRTLALILSVPDAALEPKGMIYLYDKSAGGYVMRACQGFSDVPDMQVTEQGSTDGAGASGCTTVRDPLLRCEVAPTGRQDMPFRVVRRRAGRFIHYCVPVHEGANILGLMSIFAREWPGSKRREEVFFRALSHTLALIIKRWQSENERQELLSQLTESEKMAALGRISANVAHEIRNPLTVVGGFARRLLRSTPTDTKEREYSTFIVTEVSRLEEILRSVLTYSKAAAMQLLPQRIEPIVDDVLNMYTELSRDRSVTVEKAFSETREVLLDRDRAREVIVNIISNGLDAMPSGGALKVSTAEEDTQDGRFVSVRISDTGQGIPAAIRDKIFEPFFTTKVAERGVGLGLSIAKRIMEEHGGLLRLTSTDRKGTTFVLSFPLPK